MPQRTYHVLPEGRDWPEDAELIAQGLVDRAGDNVAEQAALGLYLRQYPLWTQRAFARAIHDDEIRWGEVVGAVYKMALSADQQAVVLLACSIGCGEKIRAGECLRWLTEANLGHLVDAVRHMQGR
jgi:hypothetical protein